MDGRRFDFSFQWGNQLQIPYMFRNLIINQSTDLASTYASAESAIQSNIEIIKECYGLS